MKQRERKQVETALRDLIYQAAMYQELEKDDKELYEALCEAEIAYNIVKEWEFTR